MFQRRRSQKPSHDLISSFKDSFQSLSRARHDSLLATPESAKPLDTAKLMSFDPRQYAESEENRGQHEEYHESGMSSNEFGTERLSPATGAHGVAYNFLDFSPSAAWHQPSPSANYYGSQTQYGWPSSMQQQGLPTPFSRSISLPSPDSANQHPAFLSLQDVQLQPSFNPNAFNYSNMPSFSPHGASATFNPQPQYGMQMAKGGLLPSQQYMESPTYHDASAHSQFRFQVSLLNSTAMVKGNDVPVSYLNKRQTYKIAIQDARPDHHVTSPTTYRTFIRVSFHEEKQRLHPDQHWQLWKEGRGMSEAQQHGGKLQAIEFVPQPPAPGHHANVHLEKDAIDGFCVTWNVAPGHRPVCEVQFRCNFLSTDFSRSKGVKGIPVRLCAKNEVVGFSNAMGPPPSEPEICYCKIKLFRDHGAERKLTNDEAAVRRSIKKSEDQLRDPPPEEADEPVQVSSTGKRRASEFSAGTQRPSKFARKRATSVSSDGSSQGQVGGEGDLAQKLQNLNRLLRSRMEVTWFALQGEETDDPDVYPVELTDDTTKPPSESSPETKRLPRSGTGLTDTSQASAGSHAGQTVSPPTRRRSYLQVPTPATSQRSSTDSKIGDELKQESPADSSKSTLQKHTSLPEESKRATMIQLGQGRSIQAVDVDPDYQPAPEPRVKPVAYFYVKLISRNDPSLGDLYRACYLYERTGSAMISAIARKANINPMDVISTSYVKQPGQWDLHVGIDDDLVYHIRDGEDMTAEFQEVETMSGSPKSTGQGPPRYRLTIR